MPDLSLLLREALGLMGGTNAIAQDFWAERARAALRAHDAEQARLPESRGTTHTQLIAYHLEAEDQPHV